VTASHAVSPSAVAVVVIVLGVVLMPLALHFGDVVQWLLSFGTAALVVAVMHQVPGSIRGWLLLAPFGAACAYKMLRGDTRGRTGTWDAFRRRRRP